MEQKKKRERTLRKHRGPPLFVLVLTSDGQKTGGRNIDRDAAVDWYTAIPRFFEAQRSQGTTKRKTSPSVLIFIINQQ